MSVLVVAEHLRGQVRPITLELVSAARELGDETTMAVIAKDPTSIADQVDVEGITEIVGVQVEQEEFENDVYLQAVEQLISDRSPDVVLVGFTVNGMGFAFKDYPQVWTAMDGELGDYIRSQIAARAGLVPMEKRWDLGFRQITTSARPVEKPPTWPA